MERRPVLLSSVLLRQNPHNVEEWLKRVALFEASPEKASEALWAVRLLGSPVPGASSVLTLQCSPCFFFAPPRYDR